MKKLLFLFLILCIATACSDDGDNPSGGSQATVEEALQIAETNALNRDFIDWTQTRAEVLGLFESNGFDASILRLLQILNDNQSVYIFNNGRVLNLGEVECGNNGISIDFSQQVGYIRVGSFNGNGEAANNFARGIQDAIQSADRSDLKGWVIDLTQNSGGNIYPMLAGLGPIFGNDILGYFVTPDEDLPWGYEDGKAWLRVKDNILAEVPNPYTVRNPDLKVAVIIDNSTSSSGEAVAISFIGHNEVRLFGNATCGFSRGSLVYELSNGDAFVMSVSVMADRFLELYGGPIQPDEGYVDLPDLRNKIISWLEE